MISNVLLVLSWIFIVFGTIGLFRFNNVYTRFLVSSKIDTVAFMTIVFALMLRTGFTLATLKLFIVLLFFLFTNPVSTHLIARSAYVHQLPVNSKGEEHN